MIHEFNPFVKQFKSASQLMKQPSVSHVEIRIHDDLPDIDTRTYNRPSSNEVAVIIPDYDKVKDSRKIVLTKHDNSINHIHVLNSAYDPLLYVLLFPFGEPGYSINIPLQNVDRTKFVTSMQYYRFRLMVRKKYVAKCDLKINNEKNFLNSNKFRPNEKNLHLAGRLFKQYVVDQWAKIDQERLTFFATNQKKIRAENYKCNYWLE